MRELTAGDLAVVHGGKMSLTTKYVIGFGFVVCPALGAGMLLGYYANA
ncbi:hypothetical protein [Noviluteimonas dokdonensis]|nr:hypothetical protein [Lysobacter dokdonensis]